ncbi:MAG: hypothetical protein GC159_13780 [Phycisphaera sp.]|nr:hypothetical protein [Phycisphaera sp.]
MRRRNVLIVPLGFSLMFGVAGLSVAADGSSHAGLADKSFQRQLYSGKVNSVAGNSFVLEAREGVSHVFMVTKTTEYWLDGRLADRRDVLKMGAAAEVTAEDDVALKVVVTTK